ncbi:M42 family peptidase [Clostridium sp. LBM24168]
MDDLLKNLINSYGTSGNESNIRNLIKKYLCDSNHKIYEDACGNVISKKGLGKNRIMICTHMDSTGFMVKNIDEDGIIKVDSIGYFEKQNVNHSFIRFENGTLGKIFLYESDILVDIGVDSRNDVLERIKEGDTASLVGPYLVTGNNIISPLLHNKVGCYILLKLMDKVSRENQQIYFVFSSKGETGGIGAAAAVNSIKPDYVIVVGTESTSLSDKTGNSINIGKGPVLRIMDKLLIMHEDIKNMLEEASRKSDVDVQYSISSGGSEGGLVHKELSGIRTGEIDVPCRYKYSTSEMISVCDINNTIKLLRELI